MGRKMKQYALGVCLFVFLFVVIGSALHLNPGGAFLAAVSGTPLVIHVVNRWSNNRVVERQLVTPAATRGARLDGRGHDGRDALGGGADEREPPGLAIEQPPIH